MPRKIIANQVIDRTWIAIQLGLVILCLPLLIGCKGSSEPSGTSGSSRLKSPDPPAGFVQVFRVDESKEVVSSGFVLMKQGDKAFIYAALPSNESNKARSKTADTVSSEYSIVIDAGGDESKYVPAESYVSSEISGMTGEILVANASDVPDPVNLSDGRDLKEGNILGLIKVVDNHTPEGRVFESIRQDLKITTYTAPNARNEHRATIATERQSGTQIAGFVYDSTGEFLGLLDPVNEKKYESVNGRVDTRYFDEVRSNITDNLNGKLGGYRFNQISYDGQHVVAEVSCLSWTFGEHPEGVSMKYSTSYDNIRESEIELKKTASQINEVSPGLQKWFATVKFPMTKDDATYVNFPSSERGKKQPNKFSYRFSINGSGIWPMSSNSVVLDPKQPEE